jgi:hypothetical protein
VGSIYVSGSGKFYIALFKIRERSMAGGFPISNRKQQHQKQQYQQQQQ